MLPLGFKPFTVLPLLFFDTRAICESFAQSPFSAALSYVSKGYNVAFEFV